MYKLNILEKGKIKIKSQLISLGLNALAKEYKSKFVCEKGEDAIVGMLNIGEDLRISIVAVSQKNENVEITRIIETHKVSELIANLLTNLTEKGFINVNKLNELTKDNTNE